MISLVVPTYNEAKNIEEFIKRAASAMDGQDYEIVVVDDNSPDKTADIAQEFADKYNVRVIVRYKDKGLANAVMDGIRMTMGDILGVIDADLSHPPELIPQLIEKLNEADIVVASRLVDGGGAEGWPKRRKISSFIGTFLARPLMKVKDPMSGFFFLKRKVIEGIDLKPKGYKILLEILVKANYENVKEVPFIFKDRTAGESKLSLAVSLDYLVQLLDLYLFKIQKCRRKG
jgi:dolichol-phosphate mannosyltransferase